MTKELVNVQTTIVSLITIYSRPPKGGQESHGKMETDRQLVNKLNLVAERRKRFHT